MKNEILNYCSDKGVTIDQLATITNVSVPQLYLINSNPLYNVTIATINKIFVGTKKKFKTGLSANQYLEHECFN